MRAETGSTNGAQVKGVWIRVLGIKRSMKLQAMSRDWGSKSWSSIKRLRRRRNWQ